MDLNKEGREGRERDYGPFSNDGKDDISSAMKATLEALKKWSFLKVKNHLILVKRSKNNLRIH